MARTPKSPRIVDALKHAGASRINIPTAEMESFFRRDEDSSPMPPMHYPRARPLVPGTTRTSEEPAKPELIWNGATITISDEQMQELAETGRLTLSDAQLVWRGKDRQDWSDLIVNVPPLYIQEKIHPKAIIDDLKRRTAVNREAQTDAPDLFADFNGIEPDQRAEFYQHDQHWSNRMILGDSLQVMASLAERESLRGKVQCIYFDPPYGIKFNSNWQVSTRSTDVQHGKQADISREPEQVKAFRDTWKDSLHSYLTYLRDRLTVMRDLLTESGSVFVQIGDENVHRVRAVLDEVFGSENHIAQIAVQTSGSSTGTFLGGVIDHILWYGRNASVTKFNAIVRQKSVGGEGSEKYTRAQTSELERVPLNKLRDSKASGYKVYRQDNITSQSAGREKGEGAASWFPVRIEGREIRPSMKARWKTNETGMQRLQRASRVELTGQTISYVRFIDDFLAIALNNSWTDVGGVQSRADPKVYVVQSPTTVIGRCILMASDPGDLVLDPTCGSGTTAFVAEQWGRRWITMDTSRVALALARTRLMAARYPWYLLADSREGRAKEAALTQRPQADTPVHNDIRQGFVYERVPHITLKSIANNPLIDDIWEKWQAGLEPRRAELNQLVGKDWQEWEIPREPEKSWSDHVRGVHKAWWEARIARQTEIDASIAARADVEYLYDKPYADTNRVRVAGPFTVESLSPHRVLPASEEELIDDIAAAEGRRSAADADLAGQDFAAIVIDYLRTEGVKQQDKGDRITFDSLTPWPGGKFIGACGTFIEGENGPERRAAILIGPEYGTVGRQDIVAAAREAVDARFDVLIACAFNFDAHSSELGSLGSLKILKARINPDMHMSEELKNTGRGNMFVVFGEPDVDILDDGGPQIRVKVNGVDVFDPNTGDIRSNDTAGIAAWFVDTDYNEESFFVRHAYFLGANDPYKSLRTALKADIDEDAWATLYSDTSRPFERPATGRIAVKVINHFGDEVMKVFGV
ncbi:site-specific DNA-methyltransferase [Rhizobium ruizarguesonis]|uniref:site-specific DNA-methyltransferase n=1 Tax=Rhizobium ruizarguesonis TaxID=2081791 RepID=UPI00103A4DA6|nr:site-specific DNA-methyltransferase [Rhizobium ruizarguesonis]MBY5892984.1 site-specific DNA-methyltransferase [Rhizobium leguminosarum]NEH78151.1 site-specific DNA-methyltransferase [Rhizobium ruizarguesonis]TBY54428.1 site-specific DNA-methyltransferase [Rhizobium leguminosarum bv. viciae]